MTRSSTAAWTTSLADRGRPSTNAIAPVRRPPSADVSASEDGQIQRLIGEIYDAALDQSRWSAVLAKAQTFVGGPAAAVFGAFRGEQLDLVDAGSHDRLRQIAPHVRRAVAIARTIERKSAEINAFADTFDRMSAGVFFVDATGRIVHANASGHALLAQGSPLRAASGKLVANCADAARSLNEIVAAAGQADAAGGIKGIAVALSAPDGVPYTAHVLPLTSGARRRTGASYAAAAAVFVRKATLEAPFAPEAIAGHFKLTPSELRVLLAVVQVGGIAETAEMLGIGVATVKTHLHRLFGKTGAIRQADLIRLVAGFANPLVS